MNTHYTTGENRQRPTATAILAHVKKSYKVLTRLGKVLCSDCHNPSKEAIDRLLRAGDTYASDPCDLCGKKEQLSGGAKALVVSGESRRTHPLPQGEVAT